MSTRIWRYGVKGYTREDYFWSHVDKSGDCWLWTANRDRRGYGLFCIGSSRSTRAHRYSLELHTGQPLGDLWALHRCDNPPCVNPAHLYAGTVHDNTRDRMARGRHVAHRGEKSHNAVLTDAQVNEIHARFVPGLNRWIRGNSVELAEEFGVTPDHIRRIGYGRHRRTA